MPGVHMQSKLFHATAISLYGPSCNCMRQPQTCTIQVDLKRRSSWTTPQSAIKKAEVIFNDYL